jgi:hypothetical protein
MLNLLLFKSSPRTAYTYTRANVVCILKKWEICMRFLHCDEGLNLDLN